MVDVISHPFRFSRTGEVVTLEDETTAANREGVLVTALTGKGERPMVPDFGIEDPPFSEVDMVELDACCALYGPPGVRIADVTTTYDGDEPYARTVIEFDEDGETPDGE